MIWFNNPQQKVQSLLKEMEKGKANKTDLFSLIKLLDEQPSLVPVVMDSFLDMLRRSEVKSYKSTILALNMMAETYIENVSDSLKMIIGFLQQERKHLGEREILNTIDVLSKINNRHPEQMRIAVPELLLFLEHKSPIIRERSFHMLSLIATEHPEFFINRYHELVRILNGLNIDERIYGCRIIGILLTGYKRNIPFKEIMEKTFPTLEDLHLNHPNSDLRSEAGLTLDKFKSIGFGQADKASINTGIEKSQENKSTDKPSLINIEKTTGLNSDSNPRVDNQGAINQQTAAVSLETNSAANDINIGNEDKSMIKTALEMMISGKLIESAIIIDNDARVIALSGNPIESSLLSKLTSMISLNGEDSSSRISLEQADKKIVAVRVGKKAILVVMTRANTPIGMLLHEMNKSIDKINALMGST